MKEDLEEYYLKDEVEADGLFAIKNLLLDLNESNMISEIHILDKNIFFQVFFDKLTVLKIRKSYIENNLILGIDSIVKSNGISLLIIDDNHMEDKLNKFYSCTNKDKLDRIDIIKQVFLKSPINYKILNKIETNEYIMVIHHDAQTIFIIKNILP